MTEHSRFWDGWGVADSTLPRPQPLTLPSLLLRLRVPRDEKAEAEAVQEWLKDHEPNKYLRRDLVAAGYLAG